MIDYITSPWPILVGVLLGSPLFLAVVNYWLNRADKFQTHDDAFRRDLLTRVVDLEAKLEGMTKSRDDFREKWYKSMNELNDRRFHQQIEGLNDD